MYDLKERHNHKPSLFNLRTNEITVIFRCAFHFRLHPLSHLRQRQLFTSVNSNNIYPTKNTYSCQTVTPPACTTQEDIPNPSPPQNIPVPKYPNLARKTNTQTHAYIHLKSLNASQQALIALQSLECQQCLRRLFHRTQ